MTAHWVWSSLTQPLQIRKAHSPKPLPFSPFSLFATFSIFLLLVFALIIFSGQVQYWPLCSFFLYTESFYLFTMLCCFVFLCVCVCTMSHTRTPKYFCRAITPTARLAGVNAHYCISTATLQMTEWGKAARKSHQDSRIHTRVFWKWKMCLISRSTAMHCRGDSFCTKGS